MWDKKKDILNNDQNAETRQTKDSFADLYSSDIVKAFADKMNLRKNNYFSGETSKSRIIRDFEKFVKEEYDDNILKALRDWKINGESVDIELNKIVDKGFTLADLVNTTTWSIVKNQFGTLTSEPEAISKALVNAHRNWMWFSQSYKDSHKFDDFLREIGYTAQTDQDGKMIGVRPWPKSQDQSFSSIKKICDNFMADGIHDSEMIKDCKDMMDHTIFNPTQKIACVTAVRGLADKLREVSWADANKKGKLLDIFQDEFGTEYDHSIVPAHLPWITIEWLQTTMERFFSTLAKSGLISESDLKNIQQFQMSPKTCIRVGEQTGDLPKWLYDNDIKNKTFNQLSTDFQSMINRFAQVDLVNNIADTIQDIDTHINNYAKTFDIPGNMHAFFTQFGKPIERDVDYDSPDYKEQSAELMRLSAKLNNLDAESDDYVTLQRQISDLKDRMNPHRRAIALEREIEELKNEIGQIQSIESKEKKVKELANLQSELDQEKKVKQDPTWDNYITHVAAKTSQAAIELGIDTVDGSKVAHVLQKLKKNNRNIESLAYPEEQEIMMQSSIAYQLKQVKDSKITGMLWYSFEEYARFVSGLYSLQSNQSIIMTKDNNPITLNFLSKKFVGKPLERQNLSVNDISSLENIRVEFEIDLDNNPAAEQFIRNLTGGKRSQVIEDFIQSPGKNFPKTITDGSFVKMVDKDGKEFEWYLSRYEFPDDESISERPEWSDEISEARTYVLYDKPADQLHTDRQLKSRKPSSNDPNKFIPVFISPDNIDDWQSVDIKKKKVTLSDKHLKALTAGHYAAQNLTKDELLYPTNNSQLNKKLEETDYDIQSLLNIDRRDAKISAADDTESTAVESHKKGDFMRQRSAIMAKWDDSFDCEEWMRFALEPKTAGIPTSPSGAELISGTVQRIQRDANGQIISAEIVFDTLSRIGKCSLKPHTFTANSLIKLKEAFSKVVYIDNVKKDPQTDYNNILNNLEKKFKDSAYNWNALKELQFDGKDFTKWKDKIASFVALDATKDAEKKTKNSYHVEYTIQKMWNQYKVTSSPFSSTLGKGKDGKPTEKNIKFETLTDLSGMLLILAGKKLIPYTDEEQKRMNETHPSDGIIPEKRYSTGSVWSFNTVWNVLKWWGTKMIEAWKKKHDETGKEELEHVLFNQMNIYRKLQNNFWEILEFFDMDFLDDLADESEANSMEYGFKKIESHFNHLKKFHHSHNYGWLNSLGTKTVWANEMVKWDVESALDYYDAGKQIPYKLRYKTAAGLRYMLDKYKSGYARFLSGYPRGTFIKILYGTQAYKRFEIMYAKEEAYLKSTGNNKLGNKIQEQLMLFEYNFISHNLAGWPKQDEQYTRDGGPNGGYWKNNPDAWQFQALYGRKYGNELRTTVGAIQSINIEPEAEDIKRMVDWAPFTHIKLEYYNHINCFRMKDALEELVAMQQKASTPAEADEVAVAIMTGILNGAFIHHLWNDTRDALRRVCRNSGFPLTPWMEHFDAPTKIASLLSMITANEEPSFDKKFNYRQESFHPFTYKDKGWWSTDVKKFTKDFSDWLWEGSPIRTKVLDFLHMDNIETTDDNMMYIWTHPGLPTIAWRQITQEQKNNISDIMWEFYFNTDRGAKIDNYNYAPGFKRPRTIIEQANKAFLNKTDGQWWFEQWVWDHAETYYASIFDKAPDKSMEITKDNQYRLRFFIDDFFRVFSWFWDLEYTKEEIEHFYTYVRMAQTQSKDSDRRRLLWFPIIEKIYAKGSLPPLVEKAMTKYMKFFEANIKMFDEDLWKMHHVPRDSDSNFAYAFTQNISDYIYYSEDEWQKKGDANQRMSIYNKANRDNITIINWYMQEANQQAKWTGRNRYASKKLNMTYDKKINDLTQWTSSWTYSDDTVKSSVWRLIDVTNSALADTSSVKKPTMNTLKEWLYYDKKDNNSLKNLSDDQIEEEYQNRYGMTG